MIRRILGFNPPIVHTFFYCSAAISNDKLAAGFKKTWLSVHARDHQFFLPLPSHLRKAARNLSFARLPASGGDLWVRTYKHRHLDLIKQTDNNPWPIRAFHPAELFWDSTTGPSALLYKRQSRVFPFLQDDQTPRFQHLYGRHCNEDGKCRKHFPAPGEEKGNDDD